MSLGKKIKMLRNENNMTQEDLGNTLKIAKTTLANYERDYRNPDYNTIIKIAEHFDVSTDWLLGVVEDRHTIVSKHVEPPERYKKILDSLGVEDIGIFEDEDMTDEDWKEVVEFVKKFKLKNRG